MNHPDPFPSLPDAALREYTKAAKASWQDAPLVELLDRVNRVAASFLPEADKRSSLVGRVRRIFTERSFRHYQTLHCIDVPEKDGRWASYGFRHFLQALLVRKLLWEQVPARQIVTMLNGRGTDELERMLLGGVEIVAQFGRTEEERVGTASPAAAESWRRVRVVPGIELHLLGDLPKPKPAELKQIIALLETTLRKNL